MFDAWPKRDLSSTRLKELPSCLRNTKPRSPGVTTTPYPHISRSELSYRKSDLSHRRRHGQTISPRGQTDLSYRGGQIEVQSFLFDFLKLSTDGLWINQPSFHLVLSAERGVQRRLLYLRT
ncbi:hypothetical protein HYQ46_007795 [Verticillium longisporum]|nr:hypothetical protein HYQ46_007795 [Verticillium longisporum]